MPRRIDRSKGAVVLDPDATFEGFPVGDVMFALLVGVVCRGDNFEDAGFIAAHRSNVVRAYLAQRKIPPGETMARLLASLDPADFVATFAAGVARASSWSAKEIIKLHGKSLAGVKGGAALRKGAAGFDAQVFIATALLAHGVDSATGAAQVQNALSNFADVRHVALNMLTIAKGSKKASFDVLRMTALSEESVLLRTLRPPPQR